MMKSTQTQNKKELKRSINGRVEEWRFHQNPIIWVEGPTDIYFYQLISDGIPSIVKSFGGKENAPPLSKGLTDNNYPYLLIRDGDYTILNQSRAPHKYLMRLPRYSFENFLWEPSVVNKVCCRYALCGEEKDLISGKMEKARRMFKKTLAKLIVLDVAAQESTCSLKVLPQHINAILKNDKDTGEIDQAKVNALIAKVKNKIEPLILKKAEVSVNKFLQNHCVTHLIRGHLLFSLLRIMFTNAIKLEKGPGRNISNDELIQSLSTAILQYSKSNDHKRLKQSLRTKLRDVSKRLEAYKNDLNASLSA